MLLKYDLTSLLSMASRWWQGVMRSPKVIEFIVGLQGIGVLIAGSLLWCVKILGSMGEVVAVIVNCWVYGLDAGID